MRLLSVRLIVSLIVGRYSGFPRSPRTTKSEGRSRACEMTWSAGRRSLGESLVGNVEPYLDGRSLKQLQRIVGRFSNREHLVGVAILNTRLEPIAQSSGLDQQLKIQSLAILEAIANNRKESRFVRRDGRSQNIYALPLHRNDEVAGELVIVHDASYIDAQTAHVWRETFLRVLILVVLIALVTLVIVRWSIAGPIARAAQWMKGLRTGRAGSFGATMPGSGSAPAAGAEKMETLAESLTAARSAAENEAQLTGQPGESTLDTRRRLSVHVRGQAWQTAGLFVVSNREPYSHMSPKGQLGTRPLFRRADLLPRWSRCYAPVTEPGSRTDGGDADT